VASEHETGVILDMKLSAPEHKNRKCPKHGIKGVLNTKKGAPEH